VLVRDIMTHPAITVPECATLEEAARTMLDRRIGCLPVVDPQGRLAGIITESDFTGTERCIPFSTFRAPRLFGQWVSAQELERMYAEARKILASEIMTRDVVTVTEADPVREAIVRMLHRDVNRIPVVRGGVPVGIVARHDLLKMMVGLPEAPGPE
jgi:CBS domain-containing protein